MMSFRVRQVRPTVRSPIRTFLTKAAFSGVSTVAAFGSNPGALRMLVSHHQGCGPAGLWSLYCTDVARMRRHSPPTLAGLPLPINSDLPSSFPSKPMRIIPVVALTGISQMMYAAAAVRRCRFGR
jgi:hypothetical protein